MRSFLSSCFILACLVLVGCTPSGPPTLTVKGKVTFDGEAVKEGIVYFDSTDKNVPGANGPIKDGDYSAALVKGKYTIRILANKMVPLPKGTVGPSGEKEGLEQYLPAKYNESTTLSEEISEARELNFTLTSK